MTCFNLNMHQRCHMCCSAARSCKASSAEDGGLLDPLTGAEGRAAIPQAGVRAPVHGGRKGEGAAHRMRVHRAATVAVSDGGLAAVEVQGGGRPLSQECPGACRCTTAPQRADSSLRVPGSDRTAQRLRKQLSKQKGCACSA